MKKLIFWTIGIFTGTILLAIVGLKLFFPIEKVKEKLVQLVSQNMHREVSLGKISLGLSGILIENFQLSESPNFEKGVFVKSEKFVLKFQLFPLLKKQVIIDEISLIAPNINVIKYADAQTFNFSDLISSQPTPTSQDSSVSLTISKLEIKDGQISYKDLSSKKTEIALNPIQLKVSGNDIKKPLFVEFSVKAQTLLGDKKINAELATQSILDLGTKSAEIKNLTLQSGANKLSLKGTVVNFDDPELDAELKLESLNLKDLSALNLPQDLIIEGTPNLVITAKGKQKSLAFSLFLDASDTAIKFGKNFQKPKSTKLSLSTQGNLKDLNFAEVKDLRLSAATLELKGTLNADNISENLTLNGNLNSNSFDLAQVAALSPLAKDYSAQGQLQISCSFSGLADDLNYNGKLKLQNAQGGFQDYSAKNLSGQIAFFKDRLNVESLKGDAFFKDKKFVDFDLKTTVQNFDRPDIILNAKLGTLNLNPILAEDKKAEQKSENSAEKKQSKEPATVINTKGQVSIQKFIYSHFEGSRNKLEWNLKNAANLDQAQGSLTLFAQNGTIRDIVLLKAIAPALRINPNEVAYSKLSGTWNLNNGVAQTQNTAMLSTNVDAFVNGKIYLKDFSPDLSLTAKLPAGSIGGTVGDFSNDEQGRPTFSFIAKDNWKAKLDTSQIRKRAVEKVKEKVKEEVQKKATELLQNEGKKLLEGLFKR